MQRLYWVIFGVLLVLPAGGAVLAFPGDELDERCGALVDQAVSELAQGQAVDRPDCLLNTGLSAMEMRAAAAEMAYSPQPEVRQIQPVDEVLYTRKFRRVNAGGTVHDAPGGNVIRQFGDGLHLVSYLGVSGEWVQMRQNEWVPLSETRTYDISTFAGVEIDAPLERPFAWMLAPARPSLYPGGPEHADYEVIPRYAMMNIYGTEIVDGFNWYLVGDQQWVQQLRVAKVLPTARPAEVGADEQWIAVDLFEQTATAYVGDQMVYATLISSGLPQWSTQEGLFRIYQRWVYGPMSGAAGYLGDAYSIENVANIMYFNGDMALHAAYWHDKFGYRQSRGCVNLSLMDAWWLYEWTRADEDAWVYVYSSDRYRSDLPGWAVRPR